MPNFQSPDGPLESIFVTDYDLVDQVVGTGTLWTWGNNGNGQLGDNTVTRKSSPVQTVAFGTNWKLVSGGTFHTGAIKTDGTLWLWGRNDYGQLGDNTITQKSSPVQTVAFGTNWKSVVAGNSHNACIKTDGTLWSWGRNQHGQLGDNTVTNKSSPVQTVAFGTNWKSVSSGYFHTGAIKTDGTLWLWGYNAYGQLGDNTVTRRSSPVQTVAFGTNWKSINCGRYHNGAIKTDGTLWLWGSNDYGELGNNTTGSATRKSSPVQTVTFATNWKLVSGGLYFTAAIKTDGTLWTWGKNAFGQLGDNTLGTGTYKSSPVQTIARGTNWKLVSSGNYHTAAIKTDGTLWLWGRNNYGQLGDNTGGAGTEKSSPVQTTAYGTNWKSVTSAYGHNAALYFDDNPSIIS